MIIVANCYLIIQLFILFYLFSYDFVFFHFLATIFGELKIVINYVCTYAQSTQLHITREHIHTMYVYSPGLVCGGYGDS